VSDEHGLVVHLRDYGFVRAAHVTFSGSSPTNKQIRNIITHALFIFDLFLVQLTNSFYGKTHKDIWKIIPTRPDYFILFITAAL